MSDCVSNLSDGIVIQTPLLVHVSNPSLLCLSSSRKSVKKSARPLTSYLLIAGLARGRVRSLLLWGAKGAGVGMFQTRRLGVRKKRIKSLKGDYAPWIFFLGYFCFHSVKSLAAHPVQKNRQLFLTSMCVLCLWVCVCVDMLKVIYLHKWQKGWRSVSCQRMQAFKPGNKKMFIFIIKISFSTRMMSFAYF